MDFNLHRAEVRGTVFDASVLDTEPQKIGIWKIS